MIDTINGRTPEEIKQGLECCYGNKERRFCEKCPYAGVVEGYSEVICLDYDDIGECALSYTQQLERERDELLQKNQWLEHERDAAVQDLKVYKFCTACKHGKDDLDANKSSPCFGCHSKSNWEWRGPQEVDN